MTTSHGPLTINTIDDATCTRCGCLCDDIRLRVENESRVVEAERACELGKEWFVRQRIGDGPSCCVDGEPTTLEEGYARAATILSGASYPLIFGLDHATSQSQRLAVAIADWIGGCVDIGSGTSTAALAMARTGAVSATLGEVAQRSDLIVFWGADPVEQLPRHFERYSLHAKGMFVPNGRADRRCVVVDNRETATASEADLFLKLRPNSDLEALWTLRALATGVALDAATVKRQTGVELSGWQRLMEQMMAARYGAVFHGKALSSSASPASIEALFALVRDLNHRTRFVALPCGNGGNPTGAENVLTWRTGYPAAVNLARGYPRYGPDECSAARILTRREADAALVIGGDLFAELSPSAIDGLRSIPLVALTPQESELSRAATVVFRVATYGIHTGGTVYRSDGVPLPLRPSLRSPHPSSEQVLHEIERRIPRQSP